MKCLERLKQITGK
jgi:UDP-glucose 4-epimerase